MSYVFDARTTLGLSQAGMAKELGVNQSTVSRWEADEGSMPTTGRLAIGALLAAKGKEITAAAEDAAA